jgi:NAD-dependent dihydropyrimidine dehydrogenase PreA subunit
MGRFVEVKINGRLDRGEASAVVGACPVDIFKLDHAGTLASVPEREDECILCGRCVELAPDALSVRRLYGKGRAVGVQATETASALEAASAVEAADA